MTLTVDGFSAWGKDIGGYSANPLVAAGTEAEKSFARRLCRWCQCI